MGDDESDLFLLVGGTEGCLRLAALFYAEWSETLFCGRSSRRSSGYPPGSSPPTCRSSRAARWSIREAPAVARALLRRGAVADARDRVQRCTPLHAAARRCAGAVAAALLDGGADLEARDTAGDTPLRRAVNCGQVDIAAFLLGAGADVDSLGTRGLTPLLAARSDAMRRALA